MKRIVLIASGAALAGLAACSSSAAPAAAPGNAPVPVSCAQRYQAWEHGQGTGVIAALQAVSVADTAGSAKILTAALAKAKPTVARATRYPVPACADPRGYWNVLLMHVGAAVASAGSSPSSARAAMKDVPRIENELTAELKVVVPGE